MNNLAEILHDWAGKTPDALLFTSRDVDGQITESYSCQTFNSRVNYVAQHLADHDLVHHGEPVLLIFPSGLEGIVAFMACVKIGAIPAPAPWPDRISGRAAAERIQHMAADCDARVVLTVNDGIQRLKRQFSDSDCAIDWVATDDWRGNQDDYPTSHCDTLFLQYTSGSTDLPRGVMVTHDNVIHNSNVLLDLVDGHCSGVSWLPFHHDMGLIGFYLFAIVRGGVTHLISPTDFLKRPRVWFETITETAASITSAPNFGYQYCLRDNKITDADLSDFDLSSIRMMMNGAEPVDPSTMKSFAERFQICGLDHDALVAIYGLAEHTLAVTSGGRRVVDPATINAMAASGPSENLSYRPIMSCGTPLPSVEVNIVDPANNARVADGGVGEIWLRGDSVTKGYWGTKHQEANALFSAGLQDEDGGKAYLRTGDLGFLLEGELYIAGRLKEVIQVRGRNIYPVDVESVVQRTLDRSYRSPVAAFGVTGRNGSEEVVVLIEGNRETVNLRKVASAIGEHLGVRPGVTALIPRGKLSTTTSGKLARNACSQRWQSGDIEPLEQVTSHQPADSNGGISSLLAQIEGLPDEETVEYAGLDSLTLTELQLELLRGAHRSGIDVEEFEYDMRLINKLTLGELRALLPGLSDPSIGRAGIDLVRGAARDRIGEISRSERATMLDDGELAEDIQPGRMERRDRDTGDILLTGATGFVGTFLLHGLLTSTDHSISVLVRASNANAGRERLIAALQRANVPFHSGGNGRDLEKMIRRRVRVVVGDLSEQRLGVSPGEWDQLASEVGTVYHCGAEVDYVKSYDALVDANVHGSHEVIRLCATETAKQLHLISSTFVAGWTSVEKMEESECNPPEGALNFGYAQSKWAAERLAYQAKRRGLPVNVFRPSLLTAATTGSFVQEDLVSRIFSYLVRHGLRPTCRNQLSLIPADIAAQNMIAVSQQAALPSGTFHVTASHYYNIMDACDCITRCYGYKMTPCSLDEFIDHVNEHCTREDPLFPLVPFINRNINRLSDMADKRYVNTNFRGAMEREKSTLAEPSLESTMRLIVDYLRETGMV